MWGVWAPCAGKGEVYCWTSPVTTSCGQGPKEWSKTWTVLALLQHLIQRELPAAWCCNPSSVLLLCGHQLFFSRTIYLVWLVAELRSCEHLQLRFLPSPAASCNPLWDVDWAGHPGLLTPNGFAVEKGELVWVGFSGQTCSTCLALVLSSFSTASACTVDELVAIKLVMLAVGLSLCLQKGSSFFVMFPNLAALHLFSVQTVWFLEVRKEFTSQSDYVLLDLWARAAKCRFKTFSLSVKISLALRSCAGQIKSCFLFLHLLPYLIKEVLVEEFIFNMKFYFAEIFVVFHCLSAVPW